MASSEADAQPGTITQYAEDALAVMDELGLESAAIGGMSMGGPIVLEMFTQAPERFDAMILIDTIAAAPSPMEAGIWRGVQDEARGGRASTASLRSCMPQMLTGETRQDEPAQVDYLTRVMKGATLEAALGGAKALETRGDYSATLEEIEVPTLVLVGLADPVYPFEVSQKMVDAIGDNAELAIIPGASHAAVFEHAGRGRRGHQGVLGQVADRVVGSNGEAGQTLPTRRFAPEDDVTALQAHTNLCGDLTVTSTSTCPRMLALLAATALVPLSAHAQQTADVMPLLPPTSEQLDGPEGGRRDGGRPCARAEPAGADAGAHRQARPARWLRHRGLREGTWSTPA